MKIYDRKTGEEVAFELHDLLAADDEAGEDPTRISWGGGAALIDLGEERDLDGLVFQLDDGIVFYKDTPDEIDLGDGPFALFLVGDRPPSIFWQDYVRAHPDVHAAPIKNFDAILRPHEPATPYRPYSKTCPPPPAPAPPPGMSGSVGSGSICRWVATYTYVPSPSSGGSAANLNRNTHDKMIRTSYSNDFPEQVVDMYGQGWQLVSTEYRCE